MKPAKCSNMLKLKWLMAETMCVVIAVMEKELLNRLPGKMCLKLPAKSSSH